MGEPVRLKSETSFGGVRHSVGAALSAVSGVAGALLSLAALVVGAILAIVFAATLAFTMVLASLLLGLTSVAWRLRAPSASGDLEARRAGSGHAWVTYDWNRRSH